MSTNDHLINSPAHRKWLKRQAFDQFDFFEKSILPNGSFSVLDAKHASVPALPESV